MKILIENMMVILHKLFTVSGTCAHIFCLVFLIITPNWIKVCLQLLDNIIFFLCFKPRATAILHPRFHTLNRITRLSEKVSGLNLEFQGINDFSRSISSRFSHFPARKQPLLPGTVRCPGGKQQQQRRRRSKDPSRRRRGRGCFALPTSSQR